MATSYTSAIADAAQIGIRAPGYRLPAPAHIGRVRLAVSTLERSIAFYSEVIGLAVFDQPASAPGPRIARLGAHGSDRVLLELAELPGIQPIQGRTRLGLYHTAFLLPSREALSSFVQHLAKLGTQFGAGDHLYSEALYLTDPDGLQVEVYADRPREQWRFEAMPEGLELVGATNAVRFNTMPPVEKDSWQGAPAGTTVGHVHLYVGALESASRFYHQALGLDIMTWRYPGAIFTSAGAYHHHVGLNIWAAGSPPASAADARMLFWELVLADRAEIERAAASMTAAGYLLRPDEDDTPTFTDPWGSTVALVTG